MKILKVSSSKGEYPVMLEAGLLHQAKYWLPLLQGRPFFMVSHENLKAYCEALLATLGATAESLLLIPMGESQKNITTLALILDHLTQAHFPRDGVLLALGGGVIGDLTGFAAAIYQRGINFIQVPTSLLAMVDSSIGGKTGVNFGPAKNNIGAFHAPSAVMMDIHVLKTLPEREYKAGLAEIIKHALIQDAIFFEYLATHVPAIQARDPDILTNIILRSCMIKAEIVAQDEYETGLRRHLNFGHTFGHALEAYSDYQDMVHGEAVAIGMHLALKFSAQLGRLQDDGVLQQVVELFSALGLPLKCPAHYDSKRLLALMLHDKKKKNKNLNLILLEKRGGACIYELTDIHRLQVFLEEELGP